MSQGMAKKFGIETMVVSSDFLLVVNPMNGIYTSKCLTMAKYLKKVQKLISSFEKVELKQLPREKNSHIDALINVASVVRLTNKRANPIEFLAERSILEDSGVMTIDEEEQNWIMEIV